MALTRESTTTTAATTQYGRLSLDGDYLKFAAKKPKKSWTTFRLLSIHDVKHENDACRVLVGVGMPPTVACCRYWRGDVTRKFIPVVGNEP